MSVGISLALYTDLRIHFLFYGAVGRGVVYGMSTMSGNYDSR
jgi:hypothetical protein